MELKQRLLIEARDLLNSCGKSCPQIAAGARGRIEGVLRYKKSEYELQVFQAQRLFNFWLNKVADTGLAVNGLRMFFWLGVFQALKEIAQKEDR